MNKVEVTTADMDELLAFLPIFEDEQFVPVVEWNRWPKYTAEVNAFFWRAGMPRWQDYSYTNSEASKKIGDDAFIASASLDEIKTMLTLCVRSERFGDGNWAHFLESGRIVAILHRLQAVADERRVVSSE
jgi:hypothetical protein